MLKCSWKQVCRIMLLGPGWRVGLGCKLQKHHSAVLAFQTRKPYTCIKPTPESHSHAFSPLFGCKELWDYSYPVVSQKLVNSWLRSGMDSFLFPFLSFVQSCLSLEELVPRSCALGCGHFGISHRAGDVEHCTVLPAALHVACPAGL